MALHQDSSLCGLWSTSSLPIPTALVWPSRLSGASKEQSNHIPPNNVEFNLFLQKVLTCLGIHNHFRTYAERVCLRFLENWAHLNSKKGAVFLCGFPLQSHKVVAFIGVERRLQLMYQLRSRMVCSQAAKLLVC